MFPPQTKRAIINNCPPNSNHHFQDSKGRLRNSSSEVSPFKFYPVHKDCFTVKMFCCLPYIGTLGPVGQDGHYCHTLFKVKVETRVGFIIMKNHHNHHHRHHHHRRHTGAFNIFLSNLHSIFTKAET